MKRLVAYGVFIAGLAVFGWVIGSASIECDTEAGDCGIGAAWAINGAYIGVGFGVVACLCFEGFHRLNRRRTDRETASPSGGTLIP